MKNLEPEIGMEGQIDARPHPGPSSIPHPAFSHPLPSDGRGTERENRQQISGEAGALLSVTHFAANGGDAAIPTKPYELSSDAASLTLSSGERAGVRASLCLISLLLSFAASAHAQSFSIDWFKIASGGGTSTGGVYSVSGTIGQPDAGAPMTGGNFSLTGGFWVLPIAVQSTNGPKLTIVPAAIGQATISWTPNTPGFVLQETLSLSPTSWGNSLSGATNPIFVPATLPTKFYRLSKP